MFNLVYNLGDQIYVTANLIKTDRPIGDGITSVGIFMATEQLKLNVITDLMKELGDGYCFV